MVSRRQVGRYRGRSRSLFHPRNVANVASQLRRLYVSRNQPGGFNWWKSKVSSRENRVTRTAAPKGSTGKATQKRFFTTGILGRKFTKGKRFTSSRYLRYGVAMQYERGLTLTSSDCVYAGHAFGNAAVFQTACLSVVHKLFKKAGHRISSNQSPIQNAADYRINLEYILYDGDVPLNTSYNVGSSDTYLSAGNGLRNIIEAVIIANVATAGTTFMCTRIYLQNQSNTNTFVEAVLSLQDVMLDFYCTSNMVLQNRTLADTSSGAADWEGDAVSNNPIVGKSYWGYGTGSALKVQNNVIDIADAMLVGTGYSGEISLDINQANISSQMIGTYKRPPPGGALRGVRKTAYVSVNPGHMKSSHMTFKRKIAFNKLIALLYPTLRLGTATATPTFLPLGTFRIFAFQKKLKAAASEEDVSIGFEIQATYRCLISQKHVITAPTTEVTT